MIVAAAVDPTVVFDEEMGSVISEEYCFDDSLGKKKLAVFPKSSTWYCDLLEDTMGTSLYIYICIQSEFYFEDDMG